MGMIGKCSCSVKLSTETVTSYLFSNSIKIITLKLHWCVRAYVSACVKAGGHCKPHAFDRESATQNALGLCKAIQLDATRSGS